MTCVTWMTRMTWIDLDDLHDLDDQDDLHDLDDQDDLHDVHDQDDLDDLHDLDHEEDLCVCVCTFVSACMSVSVRVYVRQPSFQMPQRQINLNWAKSETLWFLLP